MDALIVKFVTGFRVPTILSRFNDSQLPSLAVTQYVVVVEIFGENEPVVLEAIKLPPVSAS